MAFIEINSGSSFASVDGQKLKLGITELNLSLSSDRREIKITGVTVNNSQQPVKNNRGNYETYSVTLEVDDPVVVSLQSGILAQLLLAIAAKESCEKN